MADLYAIAVTTNYYLLAASEQEAKESAKLIYKERGPEASCFGEPDFSVYRTPNQSFALKTHAANFCLSGAQDG